MAAGLAVTFLIVPQGLSYAASIAGLPAIYGLYSDFVPLLLFAAYTTSQYLQVGAVAIVSLLTYEAVTKLVAPQAAAVAALKIAASAAAKAAAASRLNSTLAAADVAATFDYNVATVALIQTQIDTASLLAFFVVRACAPLLLRGARARGSRVLRGTGHLQRRHWPAAPGVGHESDGPCSHLRLSDGGVHQHRAGSVQDPLRLRQGLHRLHQHRQDVRVVHRL
jgi:hypothetical protein